MTAASAGKSYAWLYWTLLAVVSIFACTVPFAVGAEDPRIAYVCLLFAICASPLLLVEHFNGRYALLCLLMPIYFMVYGALDLVAMTQPAGMAGHPAQEFLTLTEVSILLGGMLLVVGYRLAVWMVPKQAQGQGKAFRDWPMPTIVTVGLLLWLVGVIATLIWNVKFQRTGVEFNASAGPLALMTAMLAQMVGPVGVLVLAYGLVVSRSKLLLLVMIGITGIGVVVGFVGDSKQLGMFNALLMVLSIFLIDGRISKAWLGVLALFIVFVFPVYQAYRSEVIGARGQSRADGAKDILQSLEIALAYKEKVNSGEQRAQNFFERASLKGNQGIVITRVGKDVPYQSGATLSPLLTVFIPRMILPEKRDSSAGQLFNRAFGISADERTYISPTFLGELYWNFGWFGILLGMPTLGFILGYVNSRCSFRERPSVTRLLVLAATAYCCVVRLEGNIALQYTLWLRTMLIIGVLHFVFARVSKSLPRFSMVSTSAADSPPAVPQRRFANLLE